MSRSSFHLQNKDHMKIYSVFVKKHHEREADSLMNLTFTIVICPHDNESILYERYQEQSVYDEGECSHKLILFTSLRKSIGENTMINIERRCTQISIHNSEALECKPKSNQSCQSLHKLWISGFITVNQVVIVKSHQQKT